MNKLFLWMNVQKLNKSQICVCSVILQSSTFYRCSPGQGRWDPSDTDILIMGICMDMDSPTTIRDGAMGATFSLIGDKKFCKSQCFHCTFNLKQCCMRYVLAQLQIAIQWPAKLILVWANKMFVVVRAQDFRIVGGSTDKGLLFSNLTITDYFLRSSFKDPGLEKRETK